MTHIEPEQIELVLSRALPGDTKSRLHMIDTFFDNGIISTEMRKDLIAWATGNQEPERA